MPPDVADVLREARKIKSDPDIYRDDARDWVEHGAREPLRAHARRGDRAAPHPRTDAEATAAAEFELGQYLHRAGDHAAAIPHWREAHRLYPDNWTYKRHAWNFEDPVRQGHTDAYDSSWFEDIKKIGAENYYPEIVPCPSDAIAMARIDIPDGPGGDGAMVWSLRPEMAGMVDRMITTAYQRSKLPGGRA